MKFVIQRVSKATVMIDESIYSSINAGILLFVGIEDNDDNSKLSYYTKKIVNMRIFNDLKGKMNHSLLDIKGSILVVSQFTLCANTKKGNRPSYVHAANPDHALSLYHALIQEFKNYEINVKKGRFGAHMKLDYINDGPVTILLGGNYD